MADTPNEGETVVNEPLETKVTPQVTPPEVKDEDNAVVKLQKELQQSQMRANQLENKLQAEEDAKAKANADKLAEKEEFKTLYEQEKAKREAMESEAEQREITQTLKKTKDEILNEYSDEVKELVEETGLELADVDETSLTEFKEKLDKVNARVGKQKITPNNPNANTNNPVLSGDELKMALKDDQKFHDIVTQMPGIKIMTKQ